MKIFHIVAAVFALAFLASCEDGKSYAELLNEQDRAVNNFLADQVVLLDIPEDTIFEVGEDAPYYRLDEDGSLYMQVLNAVPRATTLLITSRYISAIPATTSLPMPTASCRKAAATTFRSIRAGSATIISESKPHTSGGQAFRLLWNSCLLTAR